MPSPGRALVIAVLAASFSGFAVRSACAQLDLLLAAGAVEGALSYDGSTIVALHGEVVTITFTVEYAMGESFPQGDEFNTVASVPVAESSIFRKQSMSSDSPDVPCSLAGCTGLIFTAQTVTFTTTFHAENPGSTTFTATTSLNLRTEPNHDNNTWQVAVEVVESATVSDISVRIADVIGAEDFDQDHGEATVALDKSVTVCAWIKNNGPDDADNIVVSGMTGSATKDGSGAAGVDFFEFARVIPDPPMGTCTTGPDGFTCSGLSIAAGDSVKLNINGFGLVPFVGSFIVEAESLSGEDPNLDNNFDGITMNVEDRGPRGFVVVPASILTRVGLPVDFFVFDCPLNENGEADYGPDGIPGTDDDDCVPVPYAEWLLSGDIGSIAPILGSTSRLTPALPIGHDSAGGLILARYDARSGEAIVTVVAPAAIRGQVSFTNAGQGVDGIVVVLLDENGEFIRQDITSSRDLDGDGVIDPTTERGVFAFEDLLPGTYRLRIDLTPPWMPVDVSEMEVPLGPGNIEVPIFEIVPEGDPDSGFDFGDLPAPYPDATAACPPVALSSRCYQTLLVDDGAAHAIRSGLQLGVAIDGDPDGVPDLNAEGDDLLDGEDDEDGLYASFWPTGGGTARATIGVRNSTPDAAFLHMWIDINDDGQLGDSPDEYVVRGTIIPGNTGFTLIDAEFSVPPLPEFDPYVRIRLTTDVGSASNGRPYGLYIDGEVEDYFWDDFALPGDLGDAPDEPDASRPDVPAGYPTRLQDDGARHALSATIRLGNAMDPEVDGQPSIEADGDDTDGGLTSDDDGIVFGSGFTLVEAIPTPFSPSGFFLRYGVARGATATVIPLASVDGKLDAWIDFNRDGDWDDTGEQVFDSVPVQGDPNYTSLNIVIPADATAGVTFARFRFSIDGDLDVTGLASDGEVEDYLLRVFDRIQVTSNADSGPESLREAIHIANAATETLVIDLSSLSDAGKTSATISLESPLPAVDRAVVIDGGGNVLDGSNAGAGADGLRVSADSVVIARLNFQDFDGNGVVLAGDDVIISSGRVENNGGDGIRVLGSRSSVVDIVTRGNGGLGIDRAGDGATPNDADESDGIQNYPEISLVEITDSLRISGTLTSVPDASFAVAFVSASSCASGESGPDAVALGTRLAVTDNSGIATFTFAFPAPSTGAAGITATATGVDLGTSELSPCAFATDVEDTADQIRPELRLDGIYPNPTSAVATIVFDLPESGLARIDMFDALGRRVASSVHGPLEAGRHEVRSDVTSLPPGLYLVRLVSAGRTSARALVVL